MRHVRLTVCDDEYGSGLGFHQVNTPKYEGFMVDTTGFMIAHDILEHQNGAHNIGPIWDEIEALGSVWHIRGRHGDFLRNDKYASYITRTPESHLASDLSRMYIDWDGCEDLSVGSLKTKAHIHDTSFEEIIRLARNEIIKELHYCDEDRRDATGLDAYLEMALHRMRIGYNKSRRRFGNMWDDGPGLFVLIRDAVAAATNEIEYEGQEFRLSYGNGRAYCEEIYPEY